MPNPLGRISTRETSQDEQATPTQVVNNAGGYVFALDRWARLRRFLILGTDGGSYYASERKLTKDNAQVVIELAADPEAGARLVQEIVEVSLAGRAKKNDQAIFALAVAAGSPVPDTAHRALLAIPSVCRTGTHLFMFCGFVENFRGWGPALRKAVARWYTDRPVDRLAMQLVKYRQRDGWTHRDVLRLSHPKVPDLRWDKRKAAFDFACGRLTDPADDRLMVPSPWPEARDAGERDDLAVVRSYLELTELAEQATAAEAVQLIDDGCLPWEALPDHVLAFPEVWEALLPNMGMTALIRNLGRMTANGTLTPMSNATAAVCKSLVDAEALVEGRIHPLSVLVAMATYAQGHAVKGKLTWEPRREIVDALDEAFYLSFGAVEAAGKRTMLALDISGSMDWPESTIKDTAITARTAAAAMAMVTARVEPQWMVTAFTATPSALRSAGISEVPLSPRQRLDDVLRATNGMPVGGTDCALPMLYAMQAKLAFDTFVVYTDNETWAGTVHPFQALRQYRERMGIDAKLIVVGMVSTGFSIADPSDAGMLDVVGFDTAAPNLMSAFSRGDL